VKKVEKTNKQATITSHTNRHETFFFLSSSFVLFHSFVLFFNCKSSIFFFFFSFD